ncbi:unnamed protein product [Chrysodeixis includens]|uniref:protein O-GlcNAcase n=1 Tax=Chrysodeixis includens TaxID=689277 RepID=A0A9P0BVN0_CHRIL|nr:unnamed protein product [Chrysodeixis includens]
MDCYVPNNPQFGLVEYCSSEHGLCDPLHCTCVDNQLRDFPEDCCQQENENCCPENGDELNALSDNIACSALSPDEAWPPEDMGSFSLPPLDLEPLPSLAVSGRGVAPRGHGILLPASARPGAAALAVPLLSLLGVQVSDNIACSALSPDEAWPPRTPEDMGSFSLPPLDLEPRCPGRGVAPRGHGILLPASARPGAAALAVPLLSLLGVQVSDNIACSALSPDEAWPPEDMGSFSLPPLDLEPLPSLFPFSPCSGYNAVSGRGVAPEDMGSFSLPPLDLEPLPSLFPFSPCSGYNAVSGRGVAPRGHGILLPASARPGAAALAVPLLSLLGVQVSDNIACSALSPDEAWPPEDMGSFSLPPLDLEPLPSLFPFSPCSGYNAVSGRGVAPRGHGILLPASARPGAAALAVPLLSLLGVQVSDNIACSALSPDEAWPPEDMGSFSLPPLDLEPLPSLFPFSSCSGYKSGTGDCRERGGGEAADVLLSLKHAVVHGDCAAEAVHPQMMVNNGGYPYYEHYGGAPLFPTMSVNVSMNMTMHGCPPEQLCSQMQWNQNASTPSVNVVYPQSQNVISSSTYPSATYSFTADFRAPTQSDPLITATSTFKPLLQNTPKQNPNYSIFQQKPSYSSPKALGPSLKRSPSKLYGQETQKEQSMGSGYLLNHQSQMHPQDYGYTACVSSGKVQMSDLRPPVQPEFQRDHSHEDTFWGETLSMPILQESILRQLDADEASPYPFRRETLSMQVVLVEILPVWQSEPPHASARQHVRRDARLTLAEVRPSSRLHVGSDVTIRLPTGPIRQRRGEKTDSTCITHLVVDLELTVAGLNCAYIGFVWPIMLRAHYRALGGGSVQIQLLSEGQKSPIIFAGFCKDISSNWSRYPRLKKWGMDMYVYAPKDDYKHRAYWRELYTVEEAEHLTSLISAAKAQGIIFCYALSPGLDITYSSQKEITTLKRKLEQVSQFGCTCFALLFDDIEPEMSEADKQIFQSFAHAQVSITNEIHQHLCCPRFLLCPTQYCSTRAVPAVTSSEYLNTLGTKLSQQIDIMWTGMHLVISKTLTTECIEEITQVLRRPPVIWDNLHANDYDQKRIFLGPYCGRSPELIPLLRGVLTNPNCEYNANMIPIWTLAHWASCSLDAPQHMEAVSWDIKLERESEQGVCEDDAPLPLAAHVYHHRHALRQAINEWLPEFSIPKTAQGPVIKPQPTITVPPVPIIPILPSVNTCMSLMTATCNTSTTSTADMGPSIPTVNTSQLQALADVCSASIDRPILSTRVSPIETFNPVPNPVMNSLVSPTKVILNESIPNPIIPIASSNMSLPSEIPVSTLPVPILGLKALEENGKAMEKDVSESLLGNVLEGLKDKDDDADQIIVDDVESQSEEQPKNGDMSIGDTPQTLSPSRPSLPEGGGEPLDVDPPSAPATDSDVVMNDGMSENGSMQVEPSHSPLSTDMMVESAEPADVVDEPVDNDEESIDSNALVADDLLLLCDLFYLPFEHGSRGLRLLHDFNWLTLHAASMLPRGSKPETSEWRRRRSRFAWWMSRTRRLARRLAAADNRELHAELQPYVWELCAVLALLDGFLRWLELGKYPQNIAANTQGSYTWFSKGWREAFESGCQEPWVFRGGLTADLRRLLPVECTSDALRTLPPPTVLPLTVRPYTTADEEAVCLICHKTCRDGSDCSDLFPSDLQTLPADRLVAPFLTLVPELCMVIEDDEECVPREISPDGDDEKRTEPRINGMKPEIVGYACAVLNSKEFYKKQEVAWIPEMCTKYPEQLTERQDLSQAAKVSEPRQRDALAPALLTCCVWQLRPLARAAQSTRPADTCCELRSHRRWPQLTCPDSVTLAPRPADVLRAGQLPRPARARPAAHLPAGRAQSTRVTRSHPALLTCCVLASCRDPLAPARLLTCLLAALRAHGESYSIARQRDALAPALLTCCVLASYRSPRPAAHLPAGRAQRVTRSHPALLTCCVLASCRDPLAPARLLTCLLAALRALSPTAAPTAVTRSHPALLTCCVLASCRDPLAPARLLTCLLAALRAHGASGVHACINATDHYLHQFYSKLGFAELQRGAGGRVYLARAF